MAIDYFSGNGNYWIDVDASYQGHSGMNSLVYWRILVGKRNTYGMSAWGDTGSSGWADSNRAGFPDLWNDPSMDYNFQNGQSGGTFLIKDGTMSIPHRADGTAEYYVNGKLSLYALGVAETGTGWRSLPRIQTDTVPPPPKFLSIDEVNMTSFQYRFAGQGDGGSPILQWQVAYGLKSNTPTTYVSSSGTSTISGLAPGQTYYVWSRGRNAIGWSGWSARASVRTFAGAYVRVGGQWKQAIPYVRTGGVWKAAEPYSRINGLWRKFTP